MPGRVADDQDRTVLLVDRQSRSQRAQHPVSACDQVAPERVADDEHAQEAAPEDDTPENVADFGLAEDKTCHEDESEDRQGDDPRSGGVEIHLFRRRRKLENRIKHRAEHDQHDDRQRQSSKTASAHGQDASRSSRRRSRSDMIRSRSSEVMLPQVAISSSVR